MIQEMNFHINEVGKRTNWIKLINVTSGLEHIFLRPPEKCIAFRVRSTAVQSNPVHLHYFCRDLQKSAPLLHPRTRLHHKSHHTPFVKREWFRRLSIGYLRFTFGSVSDEIRAGNYAPSRKRRRHIKYELSYGFRGEIHLYAENLLILVVFLRRCRRSTTLSIPTDTIHKRANVAYCFTVVRAQKRLTHTLQWQMNR